MLVSFVWAGLPKTDALVPVFDLAIDWMRYAPNCWIIYTNTDATGWYNRLVPHMTKKDRLFICELNMQNKQGWMDQWMWDWMNKTRSPFVAQGLRRKRRS
jgi:hypothetical protein